MFIEFPVELYRNEPNWIRPLDKDIMDVFDQKKNKSYRNGGQAERWLIFKEDKIVGRVAAFINPKTVKKDNNQPTGGMGFFECIQDEEVAFKLFDCCKNWLVERGMEAMDGPINFGDRDAWWGLLVKGFEIEPNYRCNYHFSYYRKFFENYGFKTYFKQLTYARKTADPLSPKLAKKSKKVAGDPSYRFQHMLARDWDKYAEDFMLIYNQAWAGHRGVAKLSLTQAKQVFKQMKPIIDEKIVWFGYYHNEPIAFFIMLPEVNQIFKHVNGKLNWIGKVKFLWHKMRKTCKKMFGLVFGVVPSHQGKGIEGAIIMAARKMVQEDYIRYEDFEMNWIGDFNIKMIRVAEQVGGYVSKIHITYRKLFDESKEFERMPIKE